MGWPDHRLVDDAHAFHHDLRGLHALHFAEPDRMGDRTRHLHFRRIHSCWGGVHPPLSKIMSISTSSTTVFPPGKSDSRSSHFPNIFPLCLGPSRRRLEIRMGCPQNWKPFRNRLEPAPLPLLDDPAHRGLPDARPGYRQIHSRSSNWLWRERSRPK